MHEGLSEILTAQVGCSKKGGPQRRSAQDSYNNENHTQAGMPNDPLPRLWKEGWFTKTHPLMHWFPHTKSIQPDSLPRL